MDHRKIFLLSNGSGYPFFSFLFFFPSVLSLLFDFSYGRLTSKHFIIHKFHVDVNIQIHINVDAKKKKKKNYRRIYSMELWKDEAKISHGTVFINLQRKMLEDKIAKH